MSPSEELECLGDSELFKEPEGFYQAEKPATFSQYVLRSGRSVKLRLVGHSPLWGHLLWNAGRLVTRYLEDNEQRLVVGKSVLELGAGAGLPSLACAILGAASVVVTDYPDANLIENLRDSVQLNELDESRIGVAGYLWGNPVDKLPSCCASSQSGFDLLILADILFNHSEHAKLVSTMQMTLKRHATSCALVFFTPYRPWLLQTDLHFFDLVKGAGFDVRKVVEKVVDEVMFADDPGDEVLRRTVFGYEVKWANVDEGKVVH